jgi:hypothetical protein
VSRVSRTTSRIRLRTVNVSLVKEKASVAESGFPKEDGFVCGTLRLHFESLEDIVVEGKLVLQRRGYIDEGGRRENRMYW